MLIKISHSVSTGEKRTNIYMCVCVCVTVCVCHGVCVCVGCVLCVCVVCVCVESGSVVRTTDLEITVLLQSPALPAELRPEMNLVFLSVYACLRASGSVHQKYSDSGY